MLSTARAATSTTPQRPCHRRGRGGRTKRPSLTKPLLCVGGKSSLIGAIAIKFLPNSEIWESSSQNFEALDAKSSSPHHQRFAPRAPTAVKLSKKEENFFVYLN